MFIRVICIGAIASKLQSFNINQFLCLLGSASILIRSVSFVSSFNLKIGYVSSLDFWVTNLLVYSVLTQDFPKKLTKRNTASNMLSFVAFIVQWGIGLVINQWPVVNGNYDPATSISFVLLVFFEICALIYFVWEKKLKWGIKQPRWRNDNDRPQAYPSRPFVGVIVIFKKNKVLLAERSAAHGKMWVSQEEPRSSGNHRRGSYPRD